VHGEGLPDRLRAAMLHGDPSYLAPEQMKGSSVDARSDLFSTALLLYEAVSGKPARGRRGVPKLVDQLVAGQLRPPGIFPTLDALVMNGLDASPAKRYQSAKEFADALAAWLKARPGSPRAALAALVAEVTGKPAPAIKRPAARPATAPPRPVAPLQAMRSVIVSPWSPTPKRSPRPTPIAPSAAPLEPAPELVPPLEPAPELVPPLEPAPDLVPPAPVEPPVTVEPATVAPEVPLPAGPTPSEPPPPVTPPAPAPPPLPLIELPEPVGRLDGKTMLEPPGVRPFAKTIIEPPLFAEPPAPPPERAYATTIPEPPLFADPPALPAGESSPAPAPLHRVESLSLEPPGRSEATSAISLDWLQSLSTGATEAPAEAPASPEQPAEPAAPVPERAQPSAPVAEPAGPAASAFSDEEDQTRLLPDPGLGDKPSR
jgi:serine/threonine protein kinase